jgi:hypothetical protein
MSTLEIACGRCNKRFRVRAEFAGKTTRCPSCSAPLIVGATSAPSPTPPEDDETPRRRRPRREDEERPPESHEDWSAVDTALRREQTCLLFIGLQVFADLLLFCVARLMGGADAGNPVMLLIVLLLAVGPSLGAAALGLMARGSALGAPPLARAKGTAVASLCCGMVALLALVAFGGTVLMGMDPNTRVDDNMMMMPIIGVFVAGMAAILTFAAYTVQVGIARQSREVSAAVGRLAIGGTIGVVLLVAGACLILFLTLAFAPPPQYRGRNNFGPDREEMMLAFLLMAVLPITIIVQLILYHRLLAAGRRALSPYGERG